MNFPDELKYTSEHEWVRFTDENTPDGRQSGEVLEFNAAISESGGDDPGLINHDPYGKGWIVKIALTDASENDMLLGAVAYRELVGA